MVLPQGPSLGPQHTTQASCGQVLCMLSQLGGQSSKRLSVLPRGHPAGTAGLGLAAVAHSSGFLIEGLLPGEAPERQGPQTSSKGDIPTRPPSVSPAPKGLFPGLWAHPPQTCQTPPGTRDSGSEDSSSHKLKHVLRGCRLQDQGWRRGSGPSPCLAHCRSLGLLGSSLAALRPKRSAEKGPHPREQALGAGKCWGDFCPPPHPLQKFRRSTRVGAYREAVGRAPVSGVSQKPQLSGQRPEDAAVA